MSTVKNPRKCVLNCRTNKPLHAFPKDKIGRRVWLKQLALKQFTSNAYVCDNHFSVQMKPTEKSLKLTPWAIPDINLPESFSDDTESDSSNDDEFTIGYSNVDSEEKEIDMDSENEADDILVEDDKSMEDTIESYAPDCDNVLTKKLCNSAIKKNKVNKAVSKEDADTDLDNFEEDLEIKLGDERLSLAKSPAFEIKQKFSKKDVKKRSSNKPFSPICGVPQCYNRRENGISMHKIPRKVLENKKSLLLWHKALRIEKPFPKNFIICSNHFKEGCILNPIDRGQRRHSMLLDSAFPTINLPKLSPES